VDAGVGEPSALSEGSVDREDGLTVREATSSARSSRPGQSRSVSSGEHPHPVPVAAEAPRGDGFDPGWMIPPGDPARSTTPGGSASQASGTPDVVPIPVPDPWRATKARGPDVVVNDPSLPSAVTIPTGITWIRSVGLVAVSLHGPGSHATLDGRPMEPGRVYLIEGDWQVETETGAGLHFRPPVPGDPPPEGRG
jgi:hypothetical protein